MGKELPVAAATQNDSVLLGDLDLTSSPEDRLIAVLKSDTHFLRNDSSSRQNGNIVKNGLSVIAKGRRLDRRNTDGVLHLIENETGEWLALDVIGDDEQGALLLHGRFQIFENLVEIGDLVLRDKDEGTLELHLLALLVVDEIGRNKTAVELHPLHKLYLVLQGLALTYRNDTSLSHLFNEIGKQLSNMLIPVG